MREAGSLGNAIDPQGLHQLRGRLQQPTEQDLREVAQQFEAVFVEMMLKQMRAATPGDSFFGGNAEETYRSLFDRQVALQMARGQGMGLAPMIEEQLRANAGFETDQVHGGPRELSDYRRAPVPAAVAVRRGEPADGVTEEGAAALQRAAPAKRAEPSEPTAGGLGGKGTAWSSPREFVADIAPAARQAAERLGVPAVALVAQAALETGWGQHVIQDGSGRSSHNLFNIKAHTAAWQGDSVRVPTLEYRGGIPQREMADFRAYASVDESFADYVDFLERNPRYQQALLAGDDPRQFVRALQEAGYATDPAYADKLERIMALDGEHGYGVWAGGELLKISE
ncbi:hypothetical protein CKO15_05960 [Halorhodospira abdelmalekii]|uniref:flagellar assembly peptidoglycan hydrolase FlgJ n=1 Tax=Halorhodospira abdelmalekii TaxID=421629 RepID=UPI001906EA2F|nr:flagellar assembly peptidoglycan hydrolase FlgJ [Halorhodospira abdelmalekii]MBK1734840.1 hypothetical protein [Halorhodospira abdelmalekii]